MKLSQFSSVLHANPDKPFHLLLPGERLVPISFHITEVAHVAKTFIDCGGKVRSIETCQLQAWVWLDVDHRLRSDKMARIIDIAVDKGILPSGVDLDIEFEYEDKAISQYVVERWDVTEEAVVFNLASKHTDCLAKDVCLTALPMAAACCGGAGCC